MKKFLYSILLFMQFSALQATWVVVRIDNQSDLILVKAARNNNVEIPSISQLLKTDSNPIYLSADAFFGSVGVCKIIAHTPAGDQIDISFLGDPRHRVANGRTRYSDIASRNAAATIKQPMMARVFAVRGDDIELIGFTGYEDDNQQFGLQITGSNGVYKASLTAMNN